MRRLLLALGLVLGLAPLAEAATYYVGKNGTGNCGTATNPATRMPTIAGGIGCLSGGDTLIIGPGVYNESISWDTIPSGTGPGGEAAEAAWPGATTIRAETSCVGTACTSTIRPTAGNCTGVGNHAVIELMKFTQRRYIIFQGLEVDANSVCQQGIALSTQETVTRSDHIRMQSLYIHDGVGASGGTGLIGPIGTNTGGNATNIEVLDSVIKNLNLAGNFGTLGGNHCLYFNASGTIRRNVIANCSPTDHNGSAIATHNPTTPVTVDISGNDVSGFGFAGIAAETVLNTKVYDNVVHDGGGTDAQCAAVGVSCSGIQAGYGDATNTLIANNTVYNIAAGRSGYAIFRSFDSFGTTVNTTIQNNIVYGGTNPNIYPAGDGGTSTNNRCDSGCATAATPIFINAGAGNFHLSASSPAAITAGGVNLSGTFTTDKDGTLWGATWGMGAYKTSSSGPAAPTNLRFTP